MSGERYVIRTIRDFLRVPPVRRVQCLTEFSGWLAHVQQVASQKPIVDVGPFIWVDDGVGGIRTIAPQESMPGVAR